MILILKQEFNQNGMITKSKRRRLLLLNDLVVCVSVAPRSTEDFSGSERLSLKWTYPVADVEVYLVSFYIIISNIFLHLHRDNSLRPVR